MSFDFWSNIVYCRSRLPLRIRHFAGPVTYSVEGFLEKNSDTLARNISVGLYQSKLAIVQSLFPEGESYLDSV